MVRRDTGEWKKVGDARAPGFGGLAFGGRVDDGNNGRERQKGEQTGKQLGPWEGRAQGTFRVLWDRTTLCRTSGDLKC